MFRARARGRRRSEDVDRPLRLVTAPAAIALVAALIAITGGALWLFGGQVAVKASALGVLVNPPGNTRIAAPVAGAVARSMPPVGDRVVADQLLTSIREANGDLVAVHAPIGGTVVSMSSAAHAHVERGDPLLTIAPASSPMAAVLFVPARAVADVVPGLPAEVAPSTVDVNETGVLLGEVAEVSPLSVSRDRLLLVLGEDGLVDTVLADGPVHEVVVEFQPDPAKPLGLAWSGPGPADGDVITSGEIAVGQFVIREQSPWQALLGIDADAPEPATAAEPNPAPTAAQSLPADGRLVVDDTTIALEVARTPRERETGLMFRTELPADRGMAFVFDPAQPVSVWMRDTLIPLDLVFIRDGVVTGIDANVPPCEEDPCPTYPSPGSIDTFVELPAGRAAELGLKVGMSPDLDLG